MTSAHSKTTSISIRPFQYRDLDDIERLSVDGLEIEECDSAEGGSTEGSSAEGGRTEDSSAEEARQALKPLRRWYGFLKCLSWFPNPFQHLFCIYVAEVKGQVRGMIRVAPFNRTRSTWRVKQVAVDAMVAGNGDRPMPMDIGSQLLRYCFEAIWEARTWLIEVGVTDKTALGLYRQNGFQPLAQMTYWTIAPELLTALAEREPDLPNLLPVSNADAGLLHQLDTASMPPLVRQVFDRHIPDFKTSLFEAVMDGMKRWVKKTEVVSGYVFESQRKAAIGYFQLQLCRKENQPHSAHLTVHPAYTWLYPELLSQMARIAQDFPNQPLQLASADYQPEREEYLQQIGAERVDHTLMMSRSVWHKLRESKPVSLEGLQLSDVLQGLQPAHKPVPGRMSLLNSIRLPQAAANPLRDQVPEVVPVPKSVSDQTHSAPNDPSNQPENPPA